MPAERRNFYRLLYVQPEAPPEVIKASFRALMTTLRAHPDLGGDHERAAQLNAAYAVLSNPQQRLAYDRRLRRPPRPGGAPGGGGSPHGAGTGADMADPAGPAGAVAATSPDATPRDPAAWLADRRCPFCGERFLAAPKPGLRCLHCDSPLTPAPAADARHAPGELLGRRHAERHARDMAARLRLPGRPGDLAARLRDLSFSGLAMAADLAVPKGQALRLSTPLFDTVAQVMGCRRSGAVFTVHARLLTLQLLRDSRGVVVDLRA
jgi:curved DNA-binding protein CbpA